MDAATYCRSVCGAKCCHLRLPDEDAPIPCPRLAPDGSCSVYEQRYGELAHEDVVIVGYWKSRKYRTLENTDGALRPFPCGKVEQIHARGGLPEDVARQCCVIHPELLEGYGHQGEP